MHLRGGAARAQIDDLEVPRRALDALDIAVLVLTTDLRTRVYANANAEPLLRDGVPPNLSDAIESYVRSRRGRTPPPALRVTVMDRRYYLRVVRSNGAVPLEVVFLREEVLRDVQVLRLLEQRFDVTRREYQVVSGIRLGKTNRQIATGLGIAEGTVARHVHRLLQRMGVHNRTEMVHLVDELVKHAG
jgi:DNA-binding NarL/FixJ family response regulator